MSAIHGNCPRCDSPQPHLHPAVQAGGEVQPCRHEFHSIPTPENLRWLKAEATA